MINIDYNYMRASSYGIPGHFIEDGNDLMAVYEKFEEVVDYVARQRSGLVESITYRWLGHSTSDPEIPHEGRGGRVEEERSIIRFKDYMLRNKIATEGEIRAGRCFERRRGRIS